MRVVLRVPTSLLLSCLCMIVGCSNRYRNWAVAQFEQTCLRDSARHTVDSYIQSADRWDGFTTIGRFDALWYTRPVVAWQVEQFAERTGVSSCAEDTQAIAELRKELLCELDKYAIFYLLMTDDTNGSLRPQLSLDDAQNATWSVLLRVGDRTYCPLTVEKICRHEVDPALVALFGPRYDARYRNLYRITFPRAALQGHELLADISCMQLVLRSVAYEFAITWTAALVTSHRLYSEHIR